MKQPHILLVEDETHIAQGLIFNLELEGYLVTHAETGAAAMQAFRCDPHDLVVLDPPEAREAISRELAA